MSEQAATKQRFIIQVKDVCIAIPFEENENLLSLQNEAVKRISTHRKLQQYKDLPNKIKYIKLKTPQFDRLIECDVNDRLDEIATINDIIVLETQSDDEYNNKKINNKNTKKRLSIPQQTSSTHLNDNNKNENESHKKLSDKRPMSSRDPIKTTNNNKRASLTMMENEGQGKKKNITNAASSNKK